MRAQLVRMAVLEIYEQVRREGARADQALQRVLRREKQLRRELEEAQSESSVVERRPVPSIAMVDEEPGEAAELEADAQGFPVEWSDAFVESAGPVMLMAVDAPSSEIANAGCVVPGARLRR